MNNKNSKPWQAILYFPHFPVYLTPIPVVVQVPHAFMHGSQSAEEEEEEEFKKEVVEEEEEAEKKETLN